MGEGGAARLWLSEVSGNTRSRAHPVRLCFRTHGCGRVGTRKDVGGGGL